MYYRMEVEFLKVYYCRGGDCFWDEGGDMGLIGLAILSSLNIV